METDAQRLAMLLESRRKLERLNREQAERDAAQRQRDAETAAAEARIRRAAEEEERRRAAEAEERRAAEAAAHAAAQATAHAAAQAAAQTEYEQRCAAEQAAREDFQRELQNAQAQARRDWSHTFWTANRAIQNHLQQVVEFDKKNFKTQHKANFHAIPWPVLESPTRLCPDSITWVAVEQFLAAMEKDLGYEDFKTYIGKTQKRFHLDRWRSRGLLGNCSPMLEEALLTAQNAVIQAVNPIWERMFKFR